MDTVLYAVGLIKELFVEKLKYRYVMVCGDGKTVEILYKIKNEYGADMKWMLVMLGTWHLLKDFLNVFLKKYENILVRQLFAKFLTKSNVDSLINCTKWWKSHNYTVWLMSALLRENVNCYLDHVGAEKSRELHDKAEEITNILKKDDISQDVVDDFTIAFSSLETIFDLSYRVNDDFRQRDTKMTAYFQI